MCTTQGNWRTLVRASETLKLGAKTIGESRVNGIASSYAKCARSSTPTASRFGGRAVSRLPRVSDAPTHRLGAAEPITSFD